MIKQFAIPNKTPLALLLMSMAVGLGACSNDEPDDMSELSVYDTPDEAGNSPFSENRLAASNQGRAGSNAGDDRVRAERTGDNAEDTLARAQMMPTEGNDVEGTIRFSSLDDSVQIQVNLRGLARGSHGIHIHENGDCSAADASSAGGHFAPRNSPHGAPSDPADQSHLGDLGNIQATTAGIAQFNRQYESITLEGDNSILGRAVVVHANPDDFNSQPAGDAGSRVACGVIEEFQPAGI